MSETTIERTGRRDFAAGNGFSPPAWLVNHPALIEYVRGYESERDYYYAWIERECGEAVRGA